MDRPSDATDPPPRRGRPPGSTRAEPTSSVSTRLTASTHDRLIALANRHEQSVSATMRQLLAARLR